ncbi:MAG: tripartite tricarboxylate transporter substrate binding protein [Comamonadaceae bacterium]|nr:MAG: tripartite tricarboxylate transporter substrate binding protein [Comamonadaceae bacterium]
MDRRTATTALLGLALAPLAARAQAWPTRTLKIINPFPPGSPVDVVSRAVAQALEGGLKQTVIVDYKAGAGGTIGAAEVARAPADGYTLLVTSSSTHVIAPALRKQLPYDAVKDFVPVAMIGYGPTVIVVHPSVPANTLAEFVQYAKANPGKVSYASSGPGTILHLSGELFSHRTGAQLLHVPYKGAVPASTDLLGGQVQTMFDSISNAAPQVRAGKLKALAVLTPNRTPLLPGVPTAVEAGFTGLDFPAWLGVFAPAGLPKDVTDKLAGTLQAAIAQGEVRDKLMQSGITPAFMTGDAFAAKLAADQKLVADLVKVANVPQQ